MQRRLQDAKLILEGQGHRVGPDWQHQLSERYWGVAIQQWDAVAATGLRGDTMRVLKLTNNAQVRTLDQVQDTTANVLVKGPDLLQTTPHECAKKYKAQHIHLPEVWLHKIRVWKGERQHEHITQKYRAHQESTRTTNLDFIQLCEVIP